MLFSYQKRCTMTIFLFLFLFFNCFSNMNIFVLLDPCPSSVQALLEFEKHKRVTGELQLPTSTFSQPVIAEKEVDIGFYCI